MNVYFLKNIYFIEENSRIIKLSIYEWWNDVHFRFTNNENSRMLGNYSTPKSTGSVTTLSKWFKSFILRTVARNKPTTMEAVYQNKMPAGLYTLRRQQKSPQNLNVWNYAGARVSHLAIKKYASSFQKKHLKQQMNWSNKKYFEFW